MNSNRDAGASAHAGDRRLEENLPAMASWTISNDGDVARYLLSRLLYPPPPQLVVLEHRAIADGMEAAATFGSPSDLQWEVEVIQYDPKAREDLRSGRRRFGETISMGLKGTSR